MGPFGDRHEHQGRRLAQFLAIAILIHLAVLPMLESWIPEAPPRQETRRVQLVSLPPSQAKPHQPAKLKPEEEQRSRDEKQEKREPENDIKGQIVDLPPSPDDTPPEEYDYLSEHNTRTERETVSRHQQKDYQNAMNELSRQKADAPSSPQKASDTAQVEVGPENPKDTKEERVAGSEKVFELPTVQQRDRLALELDPSLGVLKNQTRSEEIKGNSRRLKLSMGQEELTPQEKGSAPRQGQPKIDLVPSVGVLASLTGAPANDHIQGVEEGDGTFLNSREFKYASFFNRMKRGVSQHWHPLDEYRRRDPTGNIYGQRSRVTILKVVLTSNGDINGIEITRSSGVDFLDAEAVAAFRRAGPFPNPPKGLVDAESGLIDFPFGFHIEFNRSGGLGLPF